MIVVGRKGGLRRFILYRLSSSHSIIYIMPYVGHQRSERQKAATITMYKQRWLPKPSTEDNKIDPTNPRLLSLARQKHKREMEKAKKLEYNSRRREQRICKRLEESQARAQKATEVVEERYERRLEKLEKETVCLKKDLARPEAHDRGASSRVQHAVQEALKHSSDSMGESYGVGAGETLLENGNPFSAPGTSLKTPISSPSKPPLPVD